MTKTAQHVIVTDFGNVLIPDAVVDKYERAYFRKAAPKKSKKEAMQAMERDVSRLVEAVFHINSTPLTLQEVQAIVRQVP